MLKRIERMKKRVAAEKKTTSENRPASKKRAAVEDRSDGTLRKAGPASKKRKNWVGLDGKCMIFRVFERFPSTAYFNPSHWYECLDDVRKLMVSQHVLTLGRETLTI
jgi:hypothetical protein